MRNDPGNAGAHCFDSDSRIREIAEERIEFSTGRRIKRA